MLFSGVMYGIIMVMNTYEMGLLDEMGLSASITGIIYAIMQIVAGISSKQHEKIHQKYKNKTYAEHIYMFKYTDIRREILEYKFDDKAYYYKTISQVFLKNKIICEIL